MSSRRIKIEALQALGISLPKVSRRTTLRFLFRRNSNAYTAQRELQTEVGNSKMLLTQTLHPLNPITGKVTHLVQSTEVLEEVWLHT